jgi:serine/threonine-protein kinase PknG
VLALAASRFADAEREFTLCRRAIPGEPAPLLALALCGEYRSVDDAGSRQWPTAIARSGAGTTGRRARRSAAPGFSPGSTIGQGALAVLDQVPDTSPHRGALSVATLRVRLGVLRADAASDRDGMPGAEDLLAADADLDAVAAPGSADRHRLELLVLEAALAMSRGPDRARVPSLKCAAAATGERDLRLLLAKRYSQLARQATSENHFTVLIDLANAIRPLTVR